MRTKTIEQMALKEGDRIEIKARIESFRQGYVYKNGENVETLLGFYVRVKKHIWSMKANEGDGLLYHTCMLNGESQTEPQTVRISRIKSIKKLDEL